MGLIKRTSPVKLIIGLIYKEDTVFKKTKSILLKKFGTLDFESQNLFFNHTDYYEKELGKCLKRKFLGFKRLISPCALSKIKSATNQIENKFRQGSCRLINIDPGYIDMAKLVLASTKDFCHRIYLDKGIYAEVTLVFKNKSFVFWDWTYPDYRSEEYIGIFNQIRQIYAQQCKNR